MSDIDDLFSSIKGCHKCSLCSTCNSPVPPDMGSSLFSWMIVGEAPGEKEDESGIPFVGKSGQLLDYALQGADLERSQFTVTNIVKCRPPSNRKPESSEIETCAGWFNRELQVFNPSVILMLGKTVCETLFPYISNISHGSNCSIFNKKNRVYSFLYHPSYWLRNGGKSYVDSKVIPFINDMKKSWR